MTELRTRDTQLLQLLAAGLSNEEISQEMHLTSGTIGNYLSQLYTTLEVDNRTTAVVWWFQNHGHLSDRPN